MYALVEIAGKQFKIEENSQLKVPYNSEKTGDKVTFDKVLYFDDGKTKKIGDPYIPNFSIDAKVVSHGKDKKIIVFKLKRRKGYQKRIGHQQLYTTIVIDSFNAKKTATAKKTTTKKTATTKKTTTKKTAIAKKTTTKKTAIAKKTTTKKTAIAKKTTTKKTATAKKDK